MEASKENAGVARDHLENVKLWMESNVETPGTPVFESMAFLDRFIEASQKRLPSALAIQKDKERKKKYRKGARAGAEAGQ
jgi:hypothetical protein